MLGEAAWGELGLEGAGAPRTYLPVTHGVPNLWSPTWSNPDCVSLRSSKTFRGDCPTPGTLELLALTLRKVNSKPKLGLKERVLP